MTIMLEPQAIRSFYFKKMAQIPEPPQIARREFGYRSNGVVTRHVSFSTMGELYSMLMREAPTDVYCSNALYLEPAVRPMSEKKWMGAELIFDVDAESAEQIQDAVKSTKDLVRGLKKYLGTPDEEIAVYFSGHKGFHIHVKSEKYMALDSVARAEICSLLQEKAGAVIDAQVTCDIRRIFRMPGTLNGKSGKPKVLVRDLDNFDPNRISYS